MTPLFLNFQRAWQSDWSLRLECFHQTIDGIALDCCDKVNSSSLFALFLGLRGPLVLPLVNPHTRTPVCNENMDTYIQAYMPYESLGDSSNQPCTVLYRPVQSSTAQYSLVPPNTVQYQPVQSRTAQYSLVPLRTVQYRPLQLVQPSTAQYSLVHPSTALYSPVLPSTGQYSPVRHSTAQYSPIQPSTAQ